MTAAAAVARAPARSFLGFVQGAVGTATLFDGDVRADLSNALGQILDNPGLLGQAAQNYYNTHSMGEMPMRWAQVG